LTWFGLRALGDTSLSDYGDIRYWVDLGWVRGHEDKIALDESSDGRLEVDSVTRRKVRASAYDLGVSWTMPFRLKPTLTFGYARGSGDADSDDDIDRNYRQTGIHNNKWRFNGVNRFRMYGELLRPELSNLGITTVALGFPLLKNSSVEAIYHRYRQVNAADSLRDVRINRDPNGESADVGQEFDLVFGFRESRHWEYVLIGSTFIGGRAFDSPNKRAYSLLFELTYNF
jgi:alginate production protein